MFDLNPTQVANFTQPAHPSEFELGMTRVFEKVKWIHPTKKKDDTKGPKTP
jgi:hypothetical protein